jgi:hypothetical protein
MAKVDQSKTCIESFIIFRPRWSVPPFPCGELCKRALAQVPRAKGGHSMNSHELAVLVKGQERHLAVHKCMVAGCH